MHTWSSKSIRLCIVLFLNQQGRRPIVSCVYVCGMYVVCMWCRWNGAMAMAMAMTLWLCYRVSGAVAAGDEIVMLYSSSTRNNAPARQPCISSNLQITAFNLNGQGSQGVLPLGSRSSAAAQARQVASKVAR